MRNRFMEFILAVVRPVAHVIYPFRVKGKDNVPEGAALICPNHASAADPVLVALSMPKPLIIRFMAKAEIFKKNKLFNWFFTKVGGFPVNRNGNDLAAIKTSFKALEEGYKLLMFPEGTRVKQQGEEDAKGGAILFATRTGAPIVPVYCGGKKRLFKRSTVVFGEPYHPQFAGRRPTPEEIRMLSDELLEKIYALKEAE